MRAVLVELTRRGSMSWLYAIEPSLQPSGTGGLELVEGHFLPYVDSRISHVTVGSPKPSSLSSCLAISAVEMGRLSKVEPLDAFLDTVIARVRDHGNEFPPEYEYMRIAPALLHRVAREDLGPIVQQPLLNRVCRVLDIGKAGSQSELVWQLFTIDNRDPSTRGRLNSNGDALATEIILAAAESLKGRIMSLQDKFAVVWWHGNKQTRISNGAHEFSRGQHLTLGHKNVLVNAKVLACRRHPLTMVVSFDDSGVKANWLGALYHLGEVQNDVGRGAVSALAVSWKSATHGWTKKEIIFDFI